MELMREYISINGIKVEEFTDSWGGTHVFVNGVEQDILFNDLVYLYEFAQKEEK